jgi:hypothetical protein
MAAGFDGDSQHPPQVTTSTDDQPTKLLISDLEEDNSWLEARHTVSDGGGGGGVLSRSNRAPPQADFGGSVHGGAQISIHAERYADPSLGVLVAERREQFMRSKQTVGALITELNAALASGAEHERSHVTCLLLSLCHFGRADI